MLAIAYDTSGPDAGRLQGVELPDPVPEAGDVRVRIFVSGVNPTDWKTRARADPRPWERQIPNHDGAGVIDGVGDGVDPQRVGERVWVYHTAHDRPGGTAAEYICLPSDQAVRLPDGISFEQGAGLGIPAMTAHRCLFADGPVRGLQVLVTGGAGAVGQAAIQLARFGGARVIATVSTPEKSKIARAAGAHEVVSYRGPHAAEQLRDAVDAGLDRVVDVAMAANVDHYLRLLNPHAVAACYARESMPINVSAAPLMRANALLRFVYIFEVPEEALITATRDINAALEAGAFQPLPSHRFPLGRTNDAHLACQQGVTGKVVIEVPGE